ncbi:MAG: DUF368 domain-containing protein [Motiliproteus sp.]|nr:DUF368 domain-containing protein [Motiliproteus sp.]MCW9054083.1 DUF368 domain-containing protein [Motiliproteus sp.]
MRTTKDWIYLWLRGVAMGAADAVPGVSGGTVAFITGIYEELLESIRSVNPSAVKVLFSQGIKAFWNHINGTFLVVLLFGILGSLATIARVVIYLLETYPTMLWAFFFGLILSSSIWMLGQVKQWDSNKVLMLFFGAVVAYMLTMISPVQAEITKLSVVLAGAIAICAMILPGISGSFILLLMGMYAPIMGAIKGFEVDILGLFMFGCLVGLLSFSHLLSWMFRHYHDLTVALLTGFMIGSLNKVWPWKFTTSYRINSHGDQVPLVQDNVMPVSYQALTGEEPFILLALLLMLVGGALVYILELKMNSKS